MKVVILDAGRGSRLGKTGLPKALVTLVNGQTILEHQLANLAVVCSREVIRVVVGYHQDLIRASFPQLQYVENPQFAQQNTAKSLLCALETLPDEDVLWLNGDVVFRRELLPLLLQKRMSAMLVNRAKVGEEEVKYCTDGHGRILEVSKGVQRPEGESVGIHYFSRADVPLLVEGLRVCQPTDYFEAAVEFAIRRGVVVSAVVIADTDCVEIDFPEDLDLANQRLQGWR